MNDYEREHSEILRRFGAECAVLLKADGSFPLSAPCTIALYGSGARRTIKGGTGSGEVNSRYFVTVEQGLEAAGFSISTGFWLESYDNLYAAARKDFIRGLKEEAKKRHVIAALEYMGAVMPEPEYHIPMTGAGDTAVYVLSRISGEGSDRKVIPGDILLTETEKRDILQLNEQYKNFMLVLNVGGVVDLSPVMDVKNILVLSQLGVETGDILADLLLGKSYPSGKLTTTWSAWQDYQQIGDFGGRDDTLYREGIYVGYRYFDSIGKKALFPFGFGLGYTSFALKSLSVKLEGETVRLNVSVKNTGNSAGKEVVQLYASAPGGKLDKPYQGLVAFAKSGELLPGENEELTLSFALRDLASFDEKKAAWVLEKGDYVLRLGTSSAETKPAAILRLNADTLTRQVKNCLGRPDFADWKPEKREKAALHFVKVIPVKADRLTSEVVSYDLKHETDSMITGLTNEELALLNIGLFDPKMGSLSVIGNAAQSVAGAAGETTGMLKDKGVKALVMADGPAGLRLSQQYTVDEKGVHSLSNGLPEGVTDFLPEAALLMMKLMSGGKKASGDLREQYCTAIPIGTALAQSWNIAFAELCGDLVGDEMERFGVHLWLAPALNIHRDIRCGRNFEYFSEDPLISGKFAAAVTRGVQKHPGCGTTIKHFAANNQETNRYNSNSQVSERAMREIYLRGFEIAVRESQPHALMTSYNLLNGTHTSERRDLLEDILRTEFGYQGIVMTDWIISVMSGKGNKYPSPDAAKIAAAGNDLTMPGGSGDYKAMLRGLKKGTLTRRQLEINGTRIYRMISKLVH